MRNVEVISSEHLTITPAEQSSVTSVPSVVKIPDVDEKRAVVKVGST
jgi:hypothetical protein